MQRRQMAVLATALATLACTNTGGGTPTVSPPTLQQVQAAVQTMVTDLPVIRSSMVTGGASADVLAKFDKAADALQAASAPFLALNSETAQVPIIVINSVGTAVAGVLAVLPQTSMYAPIAVVVSGLITAYLAGQPVMTSMPSPAEAHVRAAAPASVR